MARLLAVHGTVRVSIVFALLATGAPGSVTAQQVPPIVSGSFDFLPYSAIDNPLPGTVEEDVKVLVHNPRFEVNIPIRLGSSGALIHTLSYSLLNFRYRGAPTLPAGAPDHLHDLAYGLTLSVPLAPGWRLAVSAQPGIASDFENVESDHVRFQGALVFTRRLNPGLSIGFGGVLLNNFGDPLPLPVLNLQSLTDRFRVDVRLPRSVAAYVRPGSRAELGVAGRVEGGFYRLGALAGPANRAKYSVISIGPELRASLHALLTARVTGGATLARRFEIQDASATALRTIDLSPGGFLRVTLELRPPARGARGERLNP